MKKNVKKSVLFTILNSLIISGFFCFAYCALALSPLYNPGETLDPKCEPTDARCTVASRIYSSENITTTGNIVIPLSATADGSGIIYKSTSTFIHNYAPDGSVGQNTFIGIDAGNIRGMRAATPDVYHEKDPAYSTAVGYHALNKLTTGMGNTAVGWKALEALTTGYRNTVVGTSAMPVVTTGYYNSAFGYASLSEITTGYNNVGYGSNSLYALTEGYWNTAVGVDTLQYLTTGNYNVALGHYASNFNVTGQYNVSLGTYAGYGYEGQSNNGNVFVGYQAGYRAGNGADNNIMIGFQTGYTDVFTGDNNILIGLQAFVPTSDTSNYLNIGDVIYGNLSTKNVGIGDTSPTQKLTVNGNILLLGTGNGIIFDAPFGTHKWYEYLNGSDLVFYDSAERVTFKAGGNVGIGTIDPVYKLDVRGGVVAGAGAYVDTSSHSSLKENYQDESVLEKISNLRINSWQYKLEFNNGDFSRHLYPTTDEFYAVFGLGRDEFTISSEDIAGVALKGVQELYAKNKELEDKLTVKELCVDDVCIDKDQLKKILNSLGN